MQKNTKKKIAPIIITLLVVLYMGSLIVLVLGAAGVISFLGGFNIAFPFPFLLIYALAGLAVIVGIILALRQRLREIDGGEEDEAGKY